MPAHDDHGIRHPTDVAAADPPASPDCRRRPTVSVDASPRPSFLRQPRSRVRRPGRRPGVLRRGVRRAGRASRGPHHRLRRRPARRRLPPGRPGRRRGRRPRSASHRGPLGHPGRREVWAPRRPWPWRRPRPPAPPTPSGTAWPSTAIPRTPPPPPSAAWSWPPRSAPARSAGACRSTRACGSWSSSPTVQLATARRPGPRCRTRWRTPTRSSISAAWAC